MEKALPYIQLVTSLALFGLVGYNLYHSQAFMALVCFLLGVALLVDLRRSKDVQEYKERNGK